MRRVLVSFAALIAFGFSVPANAGGPCFSATATLEHKGWGKPNKGDESKVMALARVQAWKVFVKDLKANQLKAYMSQEASIEADLDHYILDEKVSQNYNKDSKILSVTSCITPDLDRLAKVPGFADPQVVSGEGSIFVTLFVAREADSATTFDATVEKSSSATAASKSMSMNKESAQVAGGSALTTDSQKSMASANAKASVSGSTTRRSDQITYRIISSKAVDGAMSQSLTDAGYESYLYPLVAEECDGVPQAEVEETFKTKEDLSQQQLRKSMKAARACEAKFFALGTMTADVARVHMQTGMQQVAVRVQGEIYNLSKRLPIRIATIAPQQFQGLGPSQDEARTNALSLAGAEAGKIITQALRDKGIQ